MASDLVDNNSKATDETTLSELRQKLKQRHEERRSSAPKDPETLSARNSRDRRSHSSEHHRNGRFHGHQDRRDFHRGDRRPSGGGYRGGPPPPPRGPDRFGRYPRGPPRGRGPPPPPYFRGGSPRRRSMSPGHSYSSRSRSRSRSHSHRRSPSSSDDSASSYDSRSVSSHSSDEEDRLEEEDPSHALTRDQRTVFCSQLVMRANETDLKRYFRKTLQLAVDKVILLRDKRTGRTKGGAYVELGRLEDVPKALEASGKAPDFQRFPILIKASEAEKNYTVTGAQSTLTAQQLGIAPPPADIIAEDGKAIEAQKVYVGNLDPSVSQQAIFAIFSKFGHLEKVVLQRDPNTGVSRGFAFLSYKDPKDANLAIQTMSAQVLMGRPMKTGWANQAAALPGVEIVTSTEFPSDATARIQNAHLVLSQVSTGKAPLALTAATNPVVDASSVTYQQTQPNPKEIGSADKPTGIVLVHNMFDKDQETEPGWAEEIRLDFEEECSKWGKIVEIRVIDKEPGGKIYAAFESVQQAQTCASNLAGRWFDKRQLRVEFVDKIPSTDD